MKILITNIHQLIGIDPDNKPYLSGKDMTSVQKIENAFLEIRDGLIHNFGEMKDIHGEDVASVARIFDGTGKVVMPAFVDSHTHLVFAKPRNEEYRDRLHGMSYQEIANRGGGILNSVEKLRAANIDDLTSDAIDRLSEALCYGTGAMEIKSGYGLDLESELKILRVIRRLKRISPIPIKSTFLGAHAIPKEFKDNKAGYIKLIIDEMIPRIAQEELADFIDVFCEEGYFSKEETDRILEAGVKHGLTPKVHVNQFKSLGGVEVAIKHNALSVDHLEEMTDEDMVALKASKTMPVALPACSFFLGIPYTPGRKIIDAEMPLALATDYNPGSSPTSNMQFIQSLACIQMKLTPEEALNAATINGAYAMGLSKDYGSITIGKKANVILSKPMNDLSYMSYNFGTNHIDQMILDGDEFNGLSNPYKL